jgi:hypothetical protein
MFYGDFASRIRLMGTAGARANDILALTCKQPTLRSAGFECRVLRLDAQECNHAADVGDSEVRRWDDNNRRRQAGADKTTDSPEEAKHTAITYGSGLCRMTYQASLSSGLVIIR